MTTKSDTPSEDRSIAHTCVSGGRAAATGVETEFEGSPQSDTALEVQVKSTGLSYTPDTVRESAWAIKVWALNPPQWLLGILRTCFPIVRIGKRCFVWRYEDVAEVLSRRDVFKVPFDEEITHLNGDVDFILGIDDRAQHALQLDVVMRAFKRADVHDKVVTISQEAAEICIAKAVAVEQEPLTKRIDAIQGLITAVPLEICRRYYGIDPADAQTFADATIDISGHLFGPPPIARQKPASRVELAAEYVRKIVDDAIQAEKREPNRRGDTVLARLVKIHENDDEARAAGEIRAILLGMIIGFVPTNTMAGGHILDVLLRKPEALAAARAAALSGDDDLLTRCLLEALRFMHINPGPFRLCSGAEAFTIAAGTPRAKRIPKGTAVLASTASAMFDSRKVREPRRFDPSRPASDYMLFGFGMHWCAGVFIAQAQLTQTFKALLKQSNPRRAREDGKLKVRGTFPDHLFVEFGPEDSQ